MAFPTSIALSLESKTALNRYVNRYLFFPKSATMWVAKRKSAAGGAKKPADDQETGNGSFRTRGYYATEQQTAES